MRNIAALFVLFSLAACATCAADRAELRVRTEQAWACVRASDQTDTEVERCFSDRDLPQPEEKTDREPVELIET